MNERVRMIEVDEATAKALEARAAACGITVSELLADLAGVHDEPWAEDLERMRAAGEGPWSPEVLSEDEQRLAEFERTREGVPWEEVSAWMRSWGTPHELPPPKMRKL